MYKLRETSLQKKAQLIMKSSGSSGSIRFGCDYSKQAATMMVRSRQAHLARPARDRRADRGRGDHDAVSAIRALWQPDQRAWSRRGFAGNAGLG
jgi:hypothetical protein